MASRMLRAMTPMLSLLLIAIVATNALALPPFNQTRIMNGTYLLGANSLAQYDQYETLYPGYADPLRFTFYNNGTVLVEDERNGAVATGTYNRVSNNKITITIPVNNQYVTLLEFRLYRVSGGGGNRWWGEVLWDNSISGYLRVQL